MTNNQNDEIELLVRVAWYYYKSGMTQEEIANRLGLNQLAFRTVLHKFDEG